jgi:hypothetical protein
MSDTKQKVSVYVEKEHLSRAKGVGYTSPTSAINKGLELLMDMITEDEQRTYSGLTEDNVRRTADVIGHIEDVTADNVGSMGDAIENAALRARVEEKDKQISDKNTEIEFLKGQITIKDQQIEKRDADIKNLVAITTTQTYKAIEAPGSKKPWYKFW